jgi:hypothetical protein
MADSPLDSTLMAARRFTDNVGQRTVYWILRRRRSLISTKAPFSMLVVRLPALVRGIVVA